MNSNPSPDRLAVLLAFASYRSINVGTARRFAALGITPEDFFTASPKQLAALSGLRESYFAEDKRREALEKGRREAAFVFNNGIKALFYDDESFPHRLADADDAPALVFALGDVMPSPGHVVAIVGTRHCTAYGAEFTKKLVGELAEMIPGVLIMSGLAYGIDITAHRAALAASTPTGAVLAHGLNTIYPSDHRREAQQIVKQGGFLMTEYPSSAPIHKGNFLARNRIVAAMSDVTVVVESDLKGGAMSTARIAGAYNREVMALPGRITDTYSRGCNALLARNEAMMIRDAEDLVNLMGWEAKPREGQQQQLRLLSPDQETVIGYLRQNTDATANDLCIALSMPFSRVSATLFELEIDGAIASLPGGRYNLL